MLRGIRRIQGRGLRSLLNDSKITSRRFSSQDPLARPSWNPAERGSADAEMYRGGRRGASAPKREVVANFSDIKFSETFDASRINNIHDVKEGGYVEISQSDIDTYLPEGLAGEMEEEFDLTERNAWMIRDTAKLLCRIVEEYEDTAKRGRGETMFSPNRRGLATPVNLPGLTDRNEWPDCTLRAFYYGAELNKGFKRKNFIEESEEEPLEGAMEEEERAVMVTISGEGSPVEEFIKTMQTDGKAIPTRIMLTGPRGVGKSASLNQMVVHARRRGWICLFVPEGWEQVWGGGFIQPITISNPVIELSAEDIAAADAAAAKALLAAEDSDEEEVVIDKDDLPSPEGTIYDNPEQTVKVLRGFWLAHGEVLKDVPLRFPDAINKYDTHLKQFAAAHARVTSLGGREDMDFMSVRRIVDEDDNDEEQDELDERVLDSFEYTGKFRPSNLEELVRMGVAFRDLSGPLFMDLVAELRELDLPDSPVLFAVDEYNTWEVPSAFHYRMRAVMGKEICVPQALNFLGIKKAESEGYTLKNGLCVGSASSRYPDGLKVQFEDTKSSIPLVIRVPSYSQVEMASCVSYYQQQNVIDAGMNTLDVVTYRMQSGSNPRLARKEAVSFFFPLSVSKFAGSDEEMLFGSTTNDESAPPMRPIRRQSSSNEDEDEGGDIGSYDSNKDDSDVRKKRGGGNKNE